MNSSRAHERGNVLIVSLVLSAILGSILASYLNFVSTQNNLMGRSQAWNMAIGVAEAGIEEALSHMNHTNNLASNGWDFSDNRYRKQRSMSENYYTVNVSNDRNPVVIATGFVRLPASTNYISRRVRVTTQKSGLFIKAMVAKDKIDMNGNNIKTDSFDSTNPFLSGPGGRYDGTKARSNGDVATDSELINSLLLGNADIWGRVSTGPGGTIAIGPNGAVGDVEWHTSGKSGIKPGWSSDDMNVEFPDVTQPFEGSGLIPVRKQVGGVWYDHVIDSSGNWEVGDVRGSLLVRSNCNAVLLVTGTIALTGGGDAIIIQTNATLKLYMQGSSARISGNGVVNNNLTAKSFFYYGMPSNTSLVLTGNGTFTGVIYAPRAHFELKGGGSGEEDFVGASVTGSVKFGGHFKFHYDESLANLDGGRGYLVTSWNEI